MQNQIQDKISLEFPFLYDKTMQFNLKCFSKDQNVAKYACCQKQCDRNPFMCQKDSVCQCYHPKCKRVLLSMIIENMTQKTKNISKIAQQSNEYIDNIQKEINDSIEYTKVTIANNIIVLSKDNLFATQATLLQKLSIKNKHNQINSLAFYNILNNQEVVRSNKNKLDMKVFQEEAQLKWKKMKSAIIVELDSIQDSWNSFTLFYGTKVVSKIQIQQIAELFQNEDIVRTKLLYRASQHKFQIDAFHQKCNGFKNNIILIKTIDETTLGAYTPLAWSYPILKQVQCVVDDKKQTFLFSLTNKQKLIQKNQKAGIRNSNFTVQFGTQEVYDFGICSNADEIQGSYIYFRENFLDIAKVYKTDEEANWNRFTNSKSNKRTFLIKQWEVWQLTLLPKQ